MCRRPARCGAACSVSPWLGDLIVKQSRLGSICTISNKNRMVRLDTISPPGNMTHRDGPDPRSSNGRPAMESWNEHWIRTDLHLNVAEDMLGDAGNDLDTLKYDEDYDRWPEDDEDVA